LINVDHGETESSNDDWQMLVYDQEHVTGMDSKCHPEEFFTFENTNKNILNIRDV